MKNPLKILMLGWEFPPVASGGLGVASKALAEGILKNGEDITFVLPSFIGKRVFEKGLQTNLKVLFNDEDLDFTVVQKVKTLIPSPYTNEKEYQEVREAYTQKHEKQAQEKSIYGKDLLTEINRYAEELAQLKFEKKYDIIHAHDWITAPAGVRLKEVLGLPLVIHVHATEFDRSGAGYQNEIAAIEKRCWEVADKLIAVSHYTKSIVVGKYGIDPNKIEVVHNGKEDYMPPENWKYRCRKDKQTVLFLGRITMQKGPDWFLRVAEKVLAKKKDVQFLVAGSGDMMPKIIDEIVAKGFHKDVFCMGMLNKDQCDIAFRNSDVFIMPSLSEPFGLVALEALQRGCAVILSTTSGAREVLANSLQANFWDVEKMANHILASLEYPAIRNTMVDAGNREIENLTWDRQAQRTIEVYKKCI